MKIKLLLFTTLLLFGSPSSSETVINPSFDPSEILIYGDAKITQEDHSVLINQPIPLSSGLLLHNTPFRFVDSTGQLVSFSMAFRFSLSTYKGDGIDVVIVRTDSPSKFTGTYSFGLSPENRFLRIEFDSAAGMQDYCCLKYVRVTDDVAAGLVLRSGIELESIVEYNSSSKLLLVTLKEFGSATHYYTFPPILVDLPRIWGEQEVLLGMYASSARSPQKTVVHSSSLGVRWDVKGSGG